MSTKARVFVKWVWRQISPKDARHIALKPTARHFTISTLFVPNFGCTADHGSDWQPVRVAEISSNSTNIDRALVGERELLQKCQKPPVLKALIKSYKLLILKWWPETEAA
jgi:hypothetical protein